MIRLAIIGLGAVTHNIHLPACALLKDRVQVVAGCDPDAAAREHAREKWRVPELFEDARAMISKVRPDVVSIGTPPWLHYEQALMALEYGCHVFCEKPFSDDLARADEMVAAARRAGRHLVVNNQFPYMNIHLAAKKQIGSAEFGRLLYLHAWETLQASEFTEAGWRGKLERRLCFEFGIHVFELMRFFFDANPTRVLAHMPRPDASVKADLVNVVSVEFADGRAASMVLDRLSKGPERYLDMRLDGERASIHTSIGGQCRLQAGLHTRQRAPFLRLDWAMGGKATLDTGNRSRVLATDPVNPFAPATARLFQGLLDAIAGGGDPPGNAADNRHTLALMFAAYESAEIGRAVDMKQFGVA